VTSILAQVWLAAPVAGQTTADRDSSTPQDRDSSQKRDDDMTRGELANFDRFMDSHPELAEQVHKDPSLVNNKKFVEEHPALQTYLQDHPRVREEIKENLNAFMRAENRYDRREERGEERRDSDTTKRQLGLFDQFMDSHSEIAEQLRKNPSLVDNRDYVRDHPELQEFLQSHPGVREEIKENPNAFMRAENRYERHEDRREGEPGRRDDGDTTRRQLANFDGFMDSHPEIAEQLRKNPSLVDNREWVDQHPALHDYLQSHPGVREEIKEDPNAFMRKENRYERTENRQGAPNRDRDDMRGESAGFGEFLGSHSNIADQVSKDPSLLKNEEYLSSHPELQEYLKAHPGAQAQLQANPDNFIKSSRQPVKTAPVKTPATDPKGKQ
jgi:hypothetical protein